MILEYVIKYHLQDCINIISESDPLGYYNVKIDFLKLFETYPDIGDKVLCNPIEFLPICHEDIIKAQQYVLEQEEYKSIVEKIGNYSLKKNVHARIFGLPVCPELHRMVFPKNVDLGCFLKVTGTIVRVTQAKMLEYQRKYVCVKCKYENSIQAEFEHRYILKAPTKCGNDETRCKSSTFTQVNLVSREHCKDYQEIKIQEQVNKLSIGSIPGSMWVVLENELVDSCKPGDDVNICGTVRRRWRPSVQTKKSEVELVLQANYLEVCNAQRSAVIATAPDVKECFNDFWANFEACPLKGRDQILMSVCPQVYGLHLVKLALLLTVITGSNHRVEDDKRPSQDEKHPTRVRGQCHLLLVGDPGTGKSQLLRAGAELTPRSVFTSGAGSTRAGLTCSALREEGEWQLEAGALVLSDGGVCCIDEISQLREHDRTAIHEAMEQQTISIAKAGIVCKLNTRCAIVAACNPKGHYETDQPLSVNVSLGTPLLSRFDLIFILLDSKNKSWDKLVTNYILFGGTHAVDKKKQWTLEKLQMYIGLVGPKYTEMTKSANTILQSYYMTQRKSEYRDPSRTTVRMLDSLVRLSQAHCRLMYRTTILPVDAIVAISLVDLSMQDCTLEDTVDALHSTFQKYPDFDYLCTAKKLLGSEIEKKSYQLFAKFNDVTDDNIPLSASLVTSSYFNKKSNDDDDLGFVNAKENDKNLLENHKTVKDKLAATLKKHATLNKIQKKPPVAQKTKKRKHKELNKDTKCITAKSKKAKQHKKNSEADGISESDDEIKDTTRILNAIPSVNDIFNDIGVDLNYDSSAKSNEMSGNSQRESSGKKNLIKSCGDQRESNNILIGNTDKENHVNTKKTLNPNESSSKIMSKLKQFQCKQDHDISKYEEKLDISTECKEVDVVVKLENVTGSIDNTSNNKSVPTSQISIFESSDCDIDLDF
ncbi:hypothetical protein MSG28_008018 [Choristoneura fumiferana]|uniref:Uncharacterized protein n=1 Tax=Choristoneura fumiferana TaxID=7141 RepID=A0ACC0J9K6_CHOFU|nr:hypothetical protein MSG28_008018 [Choristoneura fumiferana]